MDSTPIAFSAASIPAKLPSLIIARCGQVWLPIGNPSGFAPSVVPVPASLPATIASVPAILTNSRRVIAVLGRFLGPYSLTTCLRVRAVTDVHLRAQQFPEGRAHLPGRNGSVARNLEVN